MQGRIAPAEGLPVAIRRDILVERALEFALGHPRPAWNVPPLRLCVEVRTGPLGRAALCLAQALARCGSAGGGGALGRAGALRVVLLCLRLAEVLPVFPRAFLIGRAGLVQSDGNGLLRIFDLRAIA